MKTQLATRVVLSRMLLVSTLVVGSPVLSGLGNSQAKITTVLGENNKLVLIAVEVPPGQGPDREQADIMTLAQRAAVRAVNFTQADAAGFTGNRGDFTDDAWKDFINHMQGFLDEKGAPTFTSSFVASGTAKVLDEKNGTVRFRIPGTLTQSSKLGKTTYRAALEVSAGGNPVRIRKLEQIACAGASPACQ